MNNKDLKAWLEGGRDAANEAAPKSFYAEYYRGIHDAYAAALSRLESDPEPGGMDLKMRAELEEAAGEPGYRYPSCEHEIEARFARHLLDTYGGRIKEVE